MQPTNPARAHGLRGGQVGACRPGGKGGFCRGMKQESLSSGAPPNMPSVPAGAAFQAPTGAQSAHATPLSAAPTSVVTAVKIGVRAVVTARMITIAKMTSFADLLAIAIACQPADERAKMAALPVTVHCARVLVLQGRHLVPRHSRVPRRGARARGLACARELPVVLPQVLQEGRDGARQVARAARAARGLSLIHI